MLEFTQALSFYFITFSYREYNMAKKRKGRTPKRKGPLRKTNKTRKYFLSNGFVEFEVFRYEDDFHSIRKVENEEIIFKVHPGILVNKGDKLFIRYNKNGKPDWNTVHAFLSGAWSKIKIDKQVVVKPKDFE